MLTACSSWLISTTTRLSGVVDPKYRDNFHAQKMVVIGFGMSIEEQKSLENTFKESLAKYNVTMLSGLEMFPPTRHHSRKEIYEIAKKRGADSFLMVMADNRDVSKTYVPPSYYPGRSKSTVSGSGSFITINTETEPGYTIDGYTVNKPGMNIRVLLQNPKNRDIIWTAEGSSSGNGYASFSDLIISIAEGTVKELSKEDLIALKPELQSE